MAPGMVLGTLQGPGNRGDILRGHPEQGQPSSVGVKMLSLTSGVQTPSAASMAPSTSHPEPGGPEVGTTLRWVTGGGTRGPLQGWWEAQAQGRAGLCLQSR